MPVRPTGTSSGRPRISASQPCAPPTALVWPDAPFRPSGRFEPLRTRILSDIRRLPADSNDLDKLRGHAAAAAPARGHGGGKAGRRRIERDREPCHRGGDRRLVLLADSGASQRLGPWNSWVQLCMALILSAWSLVVVLQAVWLAQS